MKQYPEEKKAAAAQLRAQGVSIYGTAKMLGVSQGAVRLWTQPGYRETVVAYKAAAGREKRVEWSRRSRVRAMARAEAAATGEDLEAVYQRFGVSMRRVSKPTNNGE